MMSATRDLDLPRAFSLTLSLTALLLAGAALAQPPRNSEEDLLEEARRLDKIAAQKAEADIRLALREAQRLTLFNSAKAVERLKGALAFVEDDTALTPERRAALTHMLKDRIRVMESDAKTAASAAAQKKEEADKAIGRRLEEDRQSAEEAKVGQELKTINKLTDEGKTEQASRAAGELAREHPKNTAVQATDRAALTADQLAKERRLRQERERQLVEAYRDISKSATLPNGDLEYPKDWKERTKGRTTAVQLTAKEKSILQALNTTISVSFKNSKLDDVLEYLQTYVGQPILLDREALKELEIAYETPITITIKGASLRTVLRRILGDLGLTYVIKEETIQATSGQRAKDMMTVRRYYIGDLLAGMGAIGNPVGPQVGLPNLLAPQGVLGNPMAFWNIGGVAVGQPANPQLQAMQNIQNMKQTADQIIELIQTSVDSQSWREHGGNGTITFHAPSMSLVIKQSAEVHALLGNGSLVK
jgi:hypothetical protein